MMPTQQSAGRQIVRSDVVEEGEGGFAGKAYKLGDVALFGGSGLKIMFISSTNVHKFQSHIYRL